MLENNNYRSNYNPSFYSHGNVLNKRIENLEKIANCGKFSSKLFGMGCITSTGGFILSPEISLELANGNFYILALMAFVFLQLTIVSALAYFFADSLLSNSNDESTSPHRLEQGLTYRS